jgi:hypothetical protein
MENEEKIYKALDRVANSLWDGLRGDRNDYTMPDALFEIARALNRIADTYATSLTNQAKSMEKDHRELNQIWDSFDGMEGDKNGS